MKDGARVDDCQRPCVAAPARHPIALHRFDDAVVERVVAFERVVQRAGCVEQFGQARVQLGNRIGRIDAEISERALDARAAAIPRFAFLVARSNEEHALRGRMGGR